MSLESRLQNFVDRTWLTNPITRSAFLELPEHQFPKILKDKAEGKIIYPRQEDVLKCFKLCPLDKVKVVIIGQDPYHTASSKAGLDGFPCLANGLCFDVSAELKAPPSLSAIVSKMEEELGGKLKVGESYLGHLPAQGVLLMNTAFTVVRNNPGSHCKVWQPFTEQIVKGVSARPFVVWLLWGNHAKSFKKFIPASHAVIEGVHPSPLAGGKFKEGSYFSTTNQALLNRGFQTIDFLNHN